MTASWWRVVAIAFVALALALGPMAGSDGAFAHAAEAGPHHTDAANHAPAGHPDAQAETEDPAEDAAHPVALGLSALGEPRADARIPVGWAEAPTASRRDRPPRARA